MARIPFTVIGGFLGAGKTTLLQHWLQGAGPEQGLRIAVLVNDFGAINLDAALVASRGADTVALSNGCVCCGIGDDLSAALLRVLDTVPPFDAVVVEASGVSDPWRVAQYALAEPRLVLDGIIVLADAAALLQHEADPLLADTLRLQVRRADLVVLNKADLADATMRAAAHEWVAQHAGAVPVVETVQAGLPTAVLSSAHWPQPRGGSLRAQPAAHGTQFETWCVQPQGPFDEAALRAWAQTLPPAVLRLKAVLHTVAGWVDVQWAGRRGTVQRSYAATDLAPGAGATAVAIGLRGQLPHAALDAGLAACLAENTRTPSRT